MKSDISPANVRNVAVMMLGKQRIKMPNQRSQWSIQLYLDCPRCDANFDFVDTEEFTETDQFNGIAVCEPTENKRATCPDCDFIFIFDVEGGI